MSRYIMLITYSFDTEYVSVPCDTEEEAVAKLCEYLIEERGIIERKFGYTPVIRKHTDTEVELFYVDNLDYVNPDTDIATYKVIEIDHCVRPEDNEVKKWIVTVGGNLHVEVTKFTGTKTQVKKYIMETVIVERENDALERFRADPDAEDDDDDESSPEGCTSVKDIGERKDGSLFALACIGGETWIFEAFPENGIPEKNAQNTYPYH